MKDFLWGGFGKAQLLLLFSDLTRLHQAPKQLLPESSQASPAATSLDLA